MVVLRLGFWGWSLEFWCWSSADGVGACGAGPSGFVWAGALYRNVEE